ncbi:MAG: radical SAM family heme chaperone HemW [Rubricoccaceae bacterium]
MAGLYVHVPFCTQRCVYCDFYFVTSARARPAFAPALEGEIAHYGRAYGGREPIETIYLGGGTPSLLPLGDVARILEAMHAHFDTAAVAEVTLEANPEEIAGEAGRAYARGLRALGVTRLSLGVQSFFADDLRFMHRAHDAAAAEDAVAAAAETFESFSVDLIFGLPEQPFEYWAANLEKALRLGAPHVSAYSLTVEDGTVLARRVRDGLVVPEGDETMRARYLFTAEYLAGRGLRHYEVSSFARPGHESRHNTGYWTHCNYLGFGPSAHSFWRETRSRAWRWHNVAHLGRWQGLLAAGELPLERREALGPEALADEAVLLGLRRLDAGLDLDMLARDYGVDLLAERAPVLAALERAGLIHPVDGRTVRLTTEGAAVADAVALRLT